MRLVSASTLALILAWAALFFSTVLLSWLMRVLVLWTWSLTVAVRANSWVLKAVWAAATRALASALAAAMSLTVLANWASRRAFSALRAASIRDEADLSAMSAWWRSSAIFSRTRRNWAAVLAMTTFMRLVAHWR